MTYDPLAELDRMQAETQQAAELEERARTQTPDTLGGRVWAWLSSVGESIDAFVYGVADVITFGYMDEIGSWLDHNILGKGESYEARLDEHRAQVEKVQEEHGTAMFLGQLAGGFVPMGALSRANSLKQMLTSSAAMGALYGSGASNADSLSGRLEGAGTGAVLGAAGGYVLGGILIPAAKWGGSKTVAIFRHGRDPSVVAPISEAAMRPRAAQAADDVIPTAPRPGVSPDAPAGSPPRLNAITGEADDVLPEGAVLSLKELLGDPDAARAALTKRLGAMTPQQAKIIAERLENAQAAGTVIDDPQYRSLLGIDLADVDVDADAVLRAAQLLEEATEEIAKKAGLGPQTGRQMDAAFARRLEDGVLMADLDEALKNSSKGVIDVNIANHAHMVAGVMFARAKDKYLPLIRQGVEGSREELAEVLTKAAHLSAIARGIKSNWGRQGAALQRKAGLAFENVADDLYEVETANAIRSRVDGALRELGDDDLKTLLDKVRTLSDVDKLEEVLLNPVRAQEYSGWRRSMNTISLFLRSNALTPATALFNTVSFVAHDFFRNGAAKRWAARGFERAGKADDALALRFEADAARGVYWEAHRRGLKALMGRVKWEYWGEIEKIAKVAGGTGAKAASKRQGLIDDGFQIPQNREYAEKATIGVQNADQFNQRLAQRAVEGGAFGNLVNIVSRVAATTSTSVVALGGAGMKLFTGAIDDWGREFIKVKETYALSARYAAREALEMGLPQKEMLEHAARRAQELAEFPPSEILQRVEEKLLKGQEPDDELNFLINRERDVDLEADRVLFNDGPQTAFGRTSAAFARGADKFAGLGQVEGLLLPYIRTPIRLFERGVVSYTPWGRASKEVQKELAAGGLRAEVVKAQMEIGTMGIMAGALMGASGTLTLTNGGFENSGNLGAGPPNRLNLPGGGYVEIGRLDPFSLTLALGGFIGQALKEGFETASEYDLRTGFDAAIQIAFLSVRDSVLDKSYLTGLRDLTQVLFAEDGGSAGNRIEQFLQRSVSRLVPLSGASRQVTETIRGSAPEAVGWVDNMLRAIPGGSLFLPDRIDALGDPVDGRVMGIAAGNSSVDPVKGQLRDLGIDISTLRSADPRGFGLTSRELSELRRLRGHEARDSYGMTMRESLSELFADPEFRALAREDRRQAVLRLMREFNEDARILFEERNPHYLANREAYRSFADYMAEGMSRDSAERQARQDTVDQGLPNPDRL